MTDDDVETAARLRAAGLPLLRIAGRLGFSGTAIRARLQALV